MPPAFRAFLALLTSALLLSTPALPFDTPLSDQAVREAYFLGQRTDQKIVDFFSGYTRHLPFPKAGPYVSEIQLLTPYAQVVELSHQNTAGYSAQQAWKDYQDRATSFAFGSALNSHLPTRRSLPSKRANARPKATGSLRALWIFGRIMTSTMSSARGKRPSNPTPSMANLSIPRTAPLSARTSGLLIPPKKWTPSKPRLRFPPRASSTLSAASISPLCVDFRRLSDHL